MSVVAGVLALAADVAVGVVSTGVIAGNPVPATGSTIGVITDRAVPPTDVTRGVVVGDGAGRHVDNRGGVRDGADTGSRSTGMGRGDHATVGASHLVGGPTPPFYLEAEGAVRAECRIGRGRHGRWCARRAAAALRPRDVPLLEGAGVAAVFEFVLKPRPDPALPAATEEPDQRPRQPEPSFGRTCQSQTITVSSPSAVRVSADSRVTRG